ncbi:ABC transporter substrate-binding protein [Helicobacter sp. CLO-3]|uniref:extracellular solute-binding protein n=1 Tax=unclassified Helicobacter TaxID=2593540 RepID=UPI0008051A4C|nr:MULTISPECIES: extracellular solute-binding protein [unclassified Helicobacter]OBV29544.1 peptide ABC transporter substrate-binding protein [Helicobacter sp. CLO-3]OHU81900.1 ABC transporter substrate-binding protein [Helicobacter sp. CLO-3]
MRDKYKILVIFAAACITAFISPAPAKAASFISLGEPAKYQNLKHFDYVNPTAPKGGVLKSYALGSFSTLNPFILLGESAAGLELVYDTLMAQSMDEPYAQYALIASDVEVARDYSSVIFTIDSRARFSDGVRVSARDVKYSFDTLMSKGSPLYRQYYADVKEAIVLDSARVKFTFKTRNNRELPLILGQLSILPEHYYMKDGRNTFGEDSLQIPLGSGAYRLKSFEVGKRVVYERDKNYWARELPSRIGQFNFDEMQYEYYRDDSVALQAFLNRQYDWRQESAAKVWARSYASKALENGDIIKLNIEHALPTGMQGFFMNTRKGVLANPLLRKALIYAFDFEWANENLFYSQYARTTSYFNHSSLASSGIPSALESKILRACDTKGELSKEIYSKAYVVPSSAINGAGAGMINGAGDIMGGVDSGRLDSGDLLQKMDSAPLDKEVMAQRENLKTARDLLLKAGFFYRDGLLINPLDNAPVQISLLLDNPAFERLALHYARSLKTLGIKLLIQKIDANQYANRVKNFDFEMIVEIVGQSLFPGNEQRYFWGSKSAQEKGSRNYSGVDSGAIDCLIERVIMAGDRDSQVLATKALDRALLWGEYVVPHYFLPSFRVAVWKYIGMPKVKPKYDLSPQLWWHENWQYEK